MRTDRCHQSHGRWPASRRLGLLPGLAAVAVACSSATGAPAESEHPAAPATATPGDLAPATTVATAAAAIAETDTAPVSSAAAGQAPRPNIVMVLLDDLDPHDGRLFAPQLMPNLSELIISQGIRFTDFHAEVPLCGPSRANLLTGQHAHNSGANSNDGTQLDPAMTIATALDGAGYHTSYVGKYLNGYRAFPADRRDPPGWDTFDVIDSNQGKYFWYELRDRDGNATQYRTDAGDYSTDVIAERAVQRLSEAPAEEPLFAIISPFTPHEPNLPAPRHEDDPRCQGLPPWAPPSYDEADVSDKPPYIAEAPPIGDAGFDLTAHCESLLAVDDLIGRVGAELERQGRLDDTLFVFTADNGMTWGEHRRLGKVSPYATAVPAYAAWPAGRGRQPREDPTTLSMIDWAPTLCDLAGCDLAPYPNGQARPDGFSFADLLADDAVPWEREAILLSVPSGGDRPVFWALRTSADDPWGRWLYVENLDGFRELYELGDESCEAWQVGDPGDPCLLENRLAGEPDAETLARVDALSARLAVLKTEQAPEPRPRTDAP